MASALHNEVVYFFGAVRFFTRLPVPSWVEHSAEGLECSTRYFPAVGLIVGGSAALCFTLASRFWPVSLAVLMSMALTLSMTGAFHEDGWSDMVDGFGAGGEKARILEIMKDSRLGTFGALALALLLVVKFFLLCGIPAPRLPAALLAGHAFSRLCVTLILRSMSYVRFEGKAKPLSTRIGDNELAFAALTAFLPLFFLPLRPAVIAVFFALAATCWLARAFKRHIGGYTGDCLGATQQLSEAAFYLGVSCAFS